MVAVSNEAQNTHRRYAQQHMTAHHENKDENKKEEEQEFAP